MDVDALVDAWKQMHTGPKRLPGQRDSDTEGDEDDEAGHEERQSRHLRELKAAENQKYELRSTRGALMHANHKLYIELRQFECGASMRWINAMMWHVDHLYSGTFLNMGRWGALIQILSGSWHAESDIIHERFPVLIEKEPSAARQHMYAAVPDAYTFVEETLLETGFLAERPQSPLAAQDPYDWSGGDDDDGLPSLDAGDGVDDDAQSEAMSDEASPRPYPEAYTYEDLLDFCIGVLPDNINLAKEYLSTEDHSMFSHSYDYLIEFQQEGGTIQIPRWRSYFYRGASEDPSQQYGVSPANRNADIAALLRSMVLWSVVLTSEAKSDAVCPNAARLNTVRGDDDSRYHTVVDQICKLHGAMLSRGEDTGSQTTAERYEKYKSFVEGYAPSVRALVAPLDDYNRRDVSRPLDSSPLVDLLARVCEVGLALMAARYASGRTARDESGTRTTTPSQMVPFPTPVLRKFQVVVHPTDEIEPEGKAPSDGDDGDDDASDRSVVSEILEISELEGDGGTELPDDSQETIVYDADDVDGL